MMTLLAPSCDGRTDQDETTKGRQHHYKRDSYPQDERWERDSHLHVQHRTYIRDTYTRTNKPTNTNTNTHTHTHTHIYIYIYKFLCRHAKFCVNVPFQALRKRLTGGCKDVYLQFHLLVRDTLQQGLYVVRCHSHGHKVRHKVL